jgi:hypothetical protein
MRKSIGGTRLALTASSKKVIDVGRSQELGRYAGALTERGCNRRGIAMHKLILRLSAATYLIISLDQPAWAQVGNSFTIDQTVQYILNKFRQARRYNDQWYQLTYDKPWFVFEYRSHPNGKYYYYKALNLRKVTNVSGTESESAGGYVSTYLKYGKLSFSCDVACARQKTDDPRKHNYDATYVTIGIPLTSDVEGEYLEKAFWHLIKLHPAPRDPFAD